MSDGWPFQDPPNVAVISTQGIVRRGEAILRVSHDEDDGGWQFLQGTPVREEEGLVVSLRTMVKIDATISQLADLPLGWSAWRESREGAWIRSRSADKVS